MARVGEVYASQQSEVPYVIQFIARDLTQLNSDVIAIWRMSFKGWSRYNLGELPEPDLFLHTTVLAGIKQAFWVKRVNAPIIDYSGVEFKSNAQDELIVNFDDRTSDVWHVWKVNHERHIVKRHLYADHTIFLGYVFPPRMVEHIIKYGPEALYTLEDE